MKQGAPQNITIYLPDGNPRGIRLADLTTRRTLATLIPRADIAIARDIEEIGQVGVYFLFDGIFDTKKSYAYIGEAENCFERLLQHNKAKDWWSFALIITSKTGAFTKAHAKYLEWECHNKAVSAQRMDLDNKSQPSKPFLPKQLLAEVYDAIEVISILVSTLGYPIFEPVLDSGLVEEENTLLLEGKGAKAKGVYTEEGFILLAGATMSKEITKGMTARLERLHEQLLKQGTIRDTGQHYELLENYICNSPSAASDLVLGNSSNGWIKWKYPNGKTLHEIIRESD